MEKEPVASGEIKLNMEQFKKLQEMGEDSEKLPEMSKEEKELAEFQAASRERKDVLNLINRIRGAKKIIDSKIMTLKMFKEELSLLEGKDERSDRDRRHAILGELATLESTLRTDTLNLLLMKEEFYYRVGKDNRAAYVVSIKNYYEDIEKKADDFIVKLKRSGWDIFE